jgi:two-component system, OmpR family, sensor histidine kinase MtrB
MGHNNNRRGHGFGLRTRATLTFGAGAALVSSTLGIMTYAVAHHYLLSRRESSSVTQAFVSATFVQQELQSLGTNVPDVLSALPSSEDTRSLLYREGNWYSTSVSIGRASIPKSLEIAVRDGKPAEQRIVLDGTPAIAVGTPIRSIGADFFQVRTLGELQQTLDTLVAVLLGAALATTIGGCLLGWSVSRRLVRPLTGVAKVASAISTGALDRRLPVTRDPDLGLLVVSFNTMVESLERRIRRDSQFASDVSHEVRSPLMAVNTSVEVMEKFRTSLPPHGQRALDLLRTEVNRFSTMIEDLLEISRMDAGAASLHREYVLLDELVLETVARHNGGVPVRIAPKAMGALIHVDKRRMQRALINLLDNADIHAGGVTHVTVDRSNSIVMIGVEDNGAGIALDECDRIFERFYRGTAAGRRDATRGSGLGLSLVTEHLRAHGGAVSAENKPEGGARFVITLPVVDR